MFGGSYLSIGENMQLKAALIAFSGTCMMSGMSLAEVPDAKVPTTPHLDGSFYLSTGHIALDTGNTVDIGGTRTQLSFDGTLRLNDQWSLGLGITHIGESNKISFILGVTEYPRFEG